MSTTNRPITDLLALDNPLVAGYIFWSAVLALKTALMSFLPTFQPLITRWIFRPWPEEYDARLREDLKRVRAAHRNDLENNLLIVLIAFLYLLTEPDATVAINLLRVIVVFRGWHSLVYGVFPIRQPARSIGFLVPWFLMAYMCGTVIWRFVEWI